MRQNAAFVSKSTEFNGIKKQKAKKTGTLKDKLIRSRN